MLNIVKCDVMECNVLQLPNQHSRKYIYHFRDKITRKYVKLASQWYMTVLFVGIFLKYFVIVLKMLSSILDIIHRIVQG